jgi:hypothetical protein
MLAEPGLRYELHCISISHYCMRAQWALQLAGLPFTIVHYLPLSHVLGIKRLQVPHSSSSSGSSSSSCPTLPASAAMHALHQCALPATVTCDGHQAAAGEGAAASAAVFSSMHTPAVFYA